MLRRLRDENLLAVTRGADARDAVDVESEVASLGDDRLARVDADPDPEPQAIGPAVLGEPLLNGDCGVHRPGRALEDGEVPVAARLHLHPAGRRHRFANDRAVVGQQIAEGVSRSHRELGRVFDVREEEAYGSRRKLDVSAHAGVVAHAERRRDRHGPVEAGN